jgi:pyruvate,water dikinase
MTKWIYGFDELCKDHDDMVGKKCANLGEMTRIGFRVPPGFAVTLEAYNKFMKETGAIEEIRRYLSTFSADPNRPADTAKYDKASEVIRAVVESKEMPEDMKGVIRQYYHQLCRTTGIDDVPVATRSAGPVSHPGQYETHLCIRGISSVTEHIIKVWSSTFNQRSLIARASLGLPLEYDPIGVAVLKMVNARASVVSGSVNPDEWVVDKVLLKINKAMISSKLKEYVFDTKVGKAIFVNIPSDRQDCPCLSEEEVLELAKIGKKLEKHYGIAQDAEWAIDSDLPFPKNVFMLQCRPEQVWNKKEPEPIAKAKSSYVDYMANRFIEGW